MKMVDSCKLCDNVFYCYTEDFKSCSRIEMAAAGLGVPVSPKKETKNFKNVPFGVYMSLKHMVDRSGR